MKKHQAPTAGKFTVMRQACNYIPSYFTTVNGSVLDIGILAVGASDLVAGCERFVSVFVVCFKSFDARGFEEVHDKRGDQGRWK